MKKNSILDRLFHRNDEGRKVVQAEQREMEQRKDMGTDLNERKYESLRAIRLEWRNTKLDASLTQALEELRTSVQACIEYSYLPLHPELKEKLDSFIGELLKLSAFQQLAEQYEKATIEVCSFYGNDEVTRAHELEWAHRAMYKSLGNEIMFSMSDNPKVTHTMNQGVYFRQKIIFPYLAEANNDALIGMATEDGETYDLNSSRSLWGRLPGADTMEDIDDLWVARDAVDVAAHTYGIWEATVGVSSEMAQQYDLNRRESWKALMGDKINVIADELGIPQKDFCWVASMHESANGPHVHIMYWDGSYTVHPQIMPDEKFKAMQERIRSSFEEGITNLKVPQLTSQEQAPAPEPELEDGEELEL